MGMGMGMGMGGGQGGAVPNPFQVRCTCVGCTWRCIHVTTDSRDSVAARTVVDLVC